MHFVASSTVLIRIKPKPRDLSDWCGAKWSRSDRGSNRWAQGKTHPLVVDNGHFFNMPKPAEFLIKVALSCADAQAKDTKHVTRIRGLNNNFGK